MKTVAAIVVTFNRLELLKECINSLRHQTYNDYSIIVVNNGSTDGTLEWLQTQLDIITINQNNVGGAGGFYIGMKYACEHGYKYSWVMDDDVVVDKYALETLINGTNYGTGFICSRVLDVNGGHCNVPKISAVKSTISGELLWGEYMDKHLIRVDIASFVSVLVPSRVVYELGLPYKEYFIWGDDTEYTSRISAKYPSYMAYNSVVIHKRKLSSVLSIFTEIDPHRLKNYFYAYRNRIHNQRYVSKKTIMFLYSIYEFFKLLLKLKLYAACIALKGTVSALFFSPKVNYPN